MKIKGRSGEMSAAILISGRRDPFIERRAGELGVLAVLEKPILVAALLELIRGVLSPLN